MTASRVKIGERKNDKIVIFRKNLLKKTDHIPDQILRLLIRNSWSAFAQSLSLVHGEFGRSKVAMAQTKPKRVSLKTCTKVSTQNASMHNCTALDCYAILLGCKLKQSRATTSLWRQLTGPKPPPHGVSSLTRGSDRVWSMGVCDVDNLHSSLKT